MPETRRRHELAEFVVAILIAAFAAIVIYCIADKLPFPAAVIAVAATAFTLTALASRSLAHREARR